MSSHSRITLTWCKGWVCLRCPWHHLSKPCCLWQNLSTSDSQSASDETKTLGSLLQQASMAHSNSTSLSAIVRSAGMHPCYQSHAGVRLDKLALLMGRHTASDSGVGGERCSRLQGHVGLTVFEDLLLTSCGPAGSSQRMMRPCSQTFTLIGG